MISQSSRPIRHFALTLTRFLTALSLSLWVGGMAFFGIMAAPVLFHPERSGIARAADTAVIAPQMVSAMLTRFGTLTNILGAALLLTVLLDGALSGAFKSRLWRLQSALSLLCVGLTLYLNTQILPQTRRDQTAILPLIARAERGEQLSPADKARRATFDTGHTGYQRLASLNLYGLMAILLLLIARGATVSASDVPIRLAKM